MSRTVAGCPNAVRALHELRIWRSQHVPGYWVVGMNVALLREADSDRGCQSFRDDGGTIH